MDQIHWLRKLGLFFVLGMIGYSFFAPPEKSQLQVVKGERQPAASPLAQATTKVNSSKSESLLSKNQASNLEADLALQKIEELYRLEECYEHSCEPSLDERSQFFSLGQKIKGLLLSLLSLVKQGEAKGIEISKIARDFLKNPDGHVQEAALDLLSTQPIYPENLEAILNDVVRSSDAELIPQAMLELKRYENPQDQARIHQVLGEALQTGAPFVSVVIAEHLGAFITAQSYWFYGEILKKIDERTLIHQHLLSTLKEYARKSSAG